VKSVRRELEKVEGLNVEYVALRDAFDLSVVEDVEKPAVLALAVRVGRTRLIDNILLNEVSS